MSAPWLECPCGAKIVHQGELRLALTQRGETQLYILCPDNSCYLREVGYIRFKRDGDKVRLNKVIFYPPFSSWNIARLGRERGSKLLRQLAAALMKREVSWKELDRRTQTSDL